MIAQSFSSFIGALATAARAGCSYLRIGFVVFVTVWAMGALALFQSGFAASDVFQMRDGFNVGARGVHTTSNAAYVVNIQCVGDRADEKTVRGAMRLFGQLFFVHPKAAVPVSVKPSHPNPTAGFGHHYDVTHESIYLICEGVLIISHLLKYSAGLLNALR